MRTVFDSHRGKMVQRRCPAQCAAGVLLWSRVRRRASLPLRFAAAAGLGFCGAAGAQTASTSAQEVLAALNDQDVLVEAVGFRLATANADLCRHGWSAGFSVHTVQQYGADYRKAAAQMFRLHDHVGIMSVVPGSPAAAAGIRKGDAILAVDGRALPMSRRARAAADFTRTGAAQRLIVRAFEDGIAAISLMRAGKPIDLEVRAVRACPSIFQLVPRRGMNGEANGFYVQVSSDLAAIAQSPDELAALLGHELAHNILGHRSSLDRLGVARGLLAPFGRNARLIRATESEADRLSIHLLARAGYAPEQAIRFWERVRDATRTPLGDPTHPRWSQRLRSMQTEQARIAAGGNFLPPDLARKLHRPLPPQPD